MAEIRHLENRHDVIYFCPGWSDLDKISETGAEWHVDCGDMVEIETRCRFQCGGRLGEFNGMSSQIHVSHCRVLPLGEFTVTIPEPHPHATLQGVSIPSAILKIVFRHILFIFLLLMQFKLWQSGGFRIVSDTLVSIIIITEYYYDPDRRKGTISVASICPSVRPSHT